MKMLPHCVVLINRFNRGRRSNVNYVFDIYENETEE